MSNKPLIEIPHDNRQNRIGMPAQLALDRFGYVINAIFGEYPYHVGSSAIHKAAEPATGFKDVDVRLILDEGRYAESFGDPEHPFDNERWCEACEALSMLGREMTGLPIDFQIQSRSHANAEFPMSKGHVRSALGIIKSIRHLNRSDG
jgi:hypothetical protein